EAERELEAGRVRRDEASAAPARAQGGRAKAGGTLARIAQQTGHQRELAESLGKASAETRLARERIAAASSGVPAQLAEGAAATARRAPPTAAAISSRPSAGRSTWRRCRRRGRTSSCATRGRSGRWTG